MSQQAEAFFSRRIGLTEGRPQPIDFGTKLAGQAGQWDIGLLQVRTRDTTDAPGEDFAAIRVRRRMLRQSYVGAIYTWRHARAEGPHLHTAGVDSNLATSTFLGTQNAAFGGYYVENTTPLDTGGGASYGLRLNFPNDPWSGLVSFRELQENYDPAIGFVPRNDLRRLNPVVRFSPRPANHPVIRSFNFGNNMRFFWDLQNELITREIDLTVLQIEFHSSDTFASVSRRRSSGSSGISTSTRASSSRVEAPTTSRATRSSSRRRLGDSSLCDPRTSGVAFSPETVKKS